MNNLEHQLALPPFTGRRTSGVLMHVTSLPSPYGIGDVGPAAFAWVDRLHDAGQSWWQALPLGPTGCGNTTDRAPSRSVPARQPNPYPMKQQIIPEFPANLSRELIEPKVATSAQPNADGEQWWPETQLPITASGNSGFAGYRHWGLNE